MKARGKRKVILAAASLCASIFGGAAVAQSQDRIEVVAAGKSDYVIAIAEQGDQQRLSDAASLLQRVINEATGVKLPVQKESAVKPDAPAFYLGKSEAARKAGIALDSIHGWAYHNKTVGKNILLVGTDGLYPVQEASIEHLGTRKAVIAFLEDQLGARFFMPGDNGRYVPKLEKFTVDAKMDKAWKPLFDYVIGRAPNDRDCGIALNLFRRTPVLYTYGGHSYYSAVPAATYGKDHPEYFALIGGKRVIEGNHLCISNPEVQELMLKEMEKQLDKGYEWVELAQTDGYQECTCQQCQAIHPDRGERLWIVHRKLAEEMLKRRPNKKIMILMYGPTVQAPKTFKSFPPNVVVQMCAYTPRFFEEWAQYNVDKTVYIYNWGEYHHVAGFAPKRTPRYCIEQVRRFLDNRVRGIYICGGYNNAAGWGLEGPSMYAFGKALENPNIDPDAIMVDYTNAAFGEAAVPMRKFFQAMHDRLETFNLFSSPNVSLPKLPAPFRTQSDFFNHFFPAEIVTEMAKNLQRAYLLAKSDRVKANLRLVELEFEYVARVADVYHMYRAYRAAPSVAALDLIAEKVAAFDKYVNGLHDGSIAMAPGLPPPFLSPGKALLQKNGRTTNAPFNWDFAFLKKNNLLPGVGIKRVFVERADKITLDGKLDEPAWQNVQFEELGEISMGALKNPSRFKVLYDDEAFYVGVECVIGSVEQIASLKPVGKDGAAYYQECVEIMLDPFGAREKHYQFVFNPVPDSTYDARYAFITDPLDPRFGRRDDSWNGEWTYAAVIDKQNLKWTAEVRIPYTTLEVAPPKPGTAWAMNVGREEYPKPRDQGGSPVLSLWSPNLEAGGFHSREVFGDVVFK